MNQRYPLANAMPAESLSVEDSIGFDDEACIPFSSLDLRDDAVVYFLWDVADDIRRDILEMIRRRKIEQANCCAVSLPPATPL